MSYLLDTNTFITAKNTFYAYDIVPTFWKRLLEKFRVGTVKIIDAVAIELLSGNDELTEWFRNNIQKQKMLIMNPILSTPSMMKKLLKSIKL